MSGGGKLIPVNFVGRGSQDPTPRISVLMLTMDRPQLIERAVESVRAQTLADWELLIVQDGDNEAVAAVIEALLKRDSRIRYWRRDKKGNIAEANTFGLRHARGRYIAILDDDDYWCEPAKLELQVRFLDDNPAVVGCGGGAICINEQGKETMRYLKPESDEDIKHHALKANPIIHSTIVYRRETALNVGFYDTSLAGFQDWDLVLKLGESGKLYNFPQYFLCYQIWEGGGSFSSQRKNTESALRIVRRHRDHYRGFVVAFSMAWVYFAYARTPVWLKKSTFAPLSRLKKALFSATS